MSLPISQKLANVKFSRLVSFDVSSKTSNSQCIEYFLPNGQKVTHGNVFGMQSPSKSNKTDDSQSFRLDYHKLQGNEPNMTQKQSMTIFNAESSNTESKKITDSSLASFEERNQMLRRKEEEQRVLDFSYEEEPTNSQSNSQSFKDFLLDENITTHRKSNCSRYNLNQKLKRLYKGDKESNGS